ncbi:hypothetical protein ABL78_5811 [Leptomonas seymouri]|uniref:Uncharacterized protein n=1 Tax=Leptomonas seymouri TaxID=5684 RepID=A0A0N1HWB0_LEPSE|nr:hypothetical protein ABL78_5811 [Leptomonas seymouri]|eukprot:KPI85118.1 hypothetical protein ABL78_5811 [Leptomonas seymouri]
MPHSPEHHGVLPKESAAGPLVQILLHVFSPLISGLADALATASPVTVHGEPSAAVDSCGELLGLSHPTASPSEVKTTALLLSSTVPNTGRHSTTSLPHHDTKQSNRSSAESPPSPLDATVAFSSSGSLIQGAEATAEAPYADSSLSPKHHDVRDESSSLSPSTPTSQPSRKQRGRLRVILKTAPSPPVAARIAQSDAHVEAPNSEGYTRCSTSLFTLPNALLWEAVAALAEAVLVDGPCFCWLQHAMLRAADASPSLSEDCGSSAGAVKRRQAKKTNGRIELTVHSDGLRDSQLDRDCHGDAAAPAARLASMLLHFDHYAANELLIYCNAAVDGAPSMTREAEANRLLGDDSGSPTRESLFPLLAAALVRSVALHTAQLLHPLVYTGQDNGKSATDFQLAWRTSKEDADPGTEGCFDSCGSVLTEFLARPFPLQGSEAGPASTFRGVQEELKQHHRRRQHARHCFADPACTLKRTPTTQKKSDSVLTKVEPQGPLTGSSPLPQLMARVMEAEEMDESAFVVVAHGPPSVASRASAEATLAKSKNGRSIHTTSHRRREATQLVDAGASILAETADCAVLAISSVLPEVFHGNEASTPTAVAQSDSERQRADAPPSVNSGGQGHCTLGKQSSSMHAANLVFLRWCAGLQHLAATMATPNSKGGNRLDGAADTSPPNFSASAALLYSYLRDYSLYPQVKHAAHCASDKVRSVSSPSQSSVASTAARASPTDPEKEASLEEDLILTHHTPSWTDARWSIRPHDGLKSGGYQSQLFQEQEGDGHSTSATCSAPSSSRMRLPCCEDEDSPALKHPRCEMQSTAFGGSGGLPSVIWVKLSAPKSDGVPTHDSVAVVEDVKASTASLFQCLLPPVDSTSSPPLDTSVMTEALDEVGAVLACVDAACASRTLLDSSSWRYGRNRISVAAASFISVEQGREEEVDGRHERTEETMRKVDNELQARLPPPSPSTKASETHGSVLNSPTRTSEKPTGMWCPPSTVGLYHHESGLLYVSGGEAYAMETE